MNRIYYLIVFLTLNYVSASDYKRSLVFVIDDTGSMTNDIAGVLKGANAIFDTVVSYNTSQIENFIFITFNDEDFITGRKPSPGIKVRAKTTDRDEFKAALQNVNVDGGYDCPEYAMTGIKKGLEMVSPGSLIYVFTDASAKDYKQYDEVRRLALKKQSQIDFILTGKCEEHEDPSFKGYTVYYDVAKVASGQVFNIEKDDINDILEYVKNSIKGHETIVTEETLPSGTSEFEFRTDAKGKDVTISLTSEDEFNTIFNITAPDGSTPSTEVVVNTKKVKLYKVNVTVPGVHKVKAYVSSEVKALVKALSSVTFQHGFSIHKPKTLDSTSTKPVSGDKPYLAIKLIEGDIELKSVRLLGMDKKPIQDYPLELQDEKENFYVTKPFNPPESMFWIEIVGYDPETDTNVMRLSLTPVEVSKATDVVAAEAKSPSVIIKGEARVEASYNKTLELVCKVLGYPKPKIVWKNKKTGTELPGTVSVLDYPYDYISILKTTVTENATYECFAENPSGSNSASVQTIISKYFRVLDTPKELYWDYGKLGRVSCLIEANPPPTILWLKDGREIKSDEHITVSADGSTLTVNSTKYSDKGQYTCEARNDFNRKLIQTRVSVVGVERPVINKTITAITVSKDAPVVIECKLIKGIPKPSISWTFSKDSEEVILEDLKDVEKIEITNTDKSHTGNYECVAENEINSDVHSVNLIVEFKPTIAEDVKIVRTEKGSKLSLSCDADGSPPPNITWYKGDVELKDKVHITHKRNKDNIDSHKTYPYEYSLSLTADIADSGKYSCKAVNYLGKAEQTINVDVIVPVKINPPTNAKRVELVGGTVLLPCEVTGYPEPSIKWDYISFGLNPDSKKIIDTSTPKLLNLNRIQVNEEGYYTCTASNRMESKNITYQIFVNAAPIIENIYTDKHFKAVEGDLVLRIKCKATGNPKPTIHWSKEGWLLANGTNYYFEDDTMIIRNVPRDAQGEYTCEAWNSLGSARDIYTVTVNSYPEFGPAVTLSIAAGNTTEINCSIPHKLTDQLRWYKDGVLQQNGELTLRNPTIRDSGSYTCRVSDTIKSKSSHVKVEVGQKPVFLTDEDLNVELDELSHVSLGCTAYGIPEPEISWYFNNDLLKSRNAEYDISGLASPGQYRCEVKNKFETITRTFNVSFSDCYIKTDELTKFQPLMLTSSLQFPMFNTYKEYMLLNKGMQLVLYCSNKFQRFHKRYVTAFCDGGSKFIINGNKYDYKDIQCMEENKHSVIKTGTTCNGLPHNTETVQIGYDLAREGRMPDSRIAIYDICMNNTSNAPIYTYHAMQSSLIDEDIIVPTWTDADKFSFNFEDAYDCNNQINRISSKLGRWFHRTDRCCFAKKQLVNSKDVSPGITQLSTFSYLNVIPQWSSCHSENWEDVEQRVRSLTKNSFRDILVWTGTAKEVSLSRRGFPITSFFMDGRGEHKPVPMFLWKVIQDPLTKSSLAIINVNVPDLSPSSVSEYILCKNVCHRANWMRSPNWRDVNRGYTYCCTIEDFERAFKYEAVFMPKMTDIVQYDPYYLSERSMGSK